MTTNLTAAGQSAITNPEEAATLLGQEEDQLAGRGRMVCTRRRRYHERTVKPRYGARADKALIEPEPRDAREPGGRRGGRDA